MIRREIGRTLALLCAAALAACQAPAAPTTTADNPQANRPRAPLTVVARNAAVAAVPAPLSVSADFGPAADVVGNIRLGAPIGRFLDRRYIDQLADGTLIVYRETDGVLTIENSREGGVFEGQPVRRWRLFTTAQQAAVIGFQIDFASLPLDRTACTHHLEDIGRIVSHRFGKFQVKPELNHFGPLEYEMAKKQDQGESYEIFLLRVSLGTAGVGPCDVHLLVRERNARHLFTLVP